MFQFYTNLWIMNQNMYVLLIQTFLTPHRVLSPNKGTNVAPTGM